MTLLPFNRGDRVLWRGQGGIVVEAKADRVVVETDDGVIRITTEEVLREHQVPSGREAS